MNSDIPYMFRDNNGRGTYTFFFENLGPKTVLHDHPNFGIIHKAVQNKEWHKIEKLIDIPRAVSAYTRGNCQIDGDRIMWNGQEVKNYLANKILSFMQANLPWQHLMNFLDNLMQNPSFNSREELYKFLETEDLPITPDGHFLAYKAVRSDFTDKYSGKILNRIGDVVTMTRSAVDDNTNHGCSKGLHAGSWSYVKSFADGCSDHIMVVKINPADVVSVPNEDCRKLRCCRYEVVKFFDGQFDQPLYNNDGSYYDYNGNDQDDYCYYDCDDCDEDDDFE